jgi:hypothetical protein
LELTDGTPATAAAVCAPRLAALKIGTKTAIVHIFKIMLELIIHAVNGVPLAHFIGKTSVIY